MIPSCDASPHEDETHSLRNESGAHSASEGPSSRRTALSSKAILLAAAAEGPIESGEACDEKSAFPGVVLMPRRRTRR